MALKSIGADLMVMLVIAGIVLMAIGGFAGYFLKSQNNSAPVVEQKQASVAAVGLANIMKSTLTNSVMLMGEVKSINGNAILISENSDTAIIRIVQGAKIFLVDAKDPNKQIPATMEDIKVGDTIAIGAKVLNSYAISAGSVVIYKLK